MILKSIGLMSMSPIYTTAHPAAAATAAAAAAAKVQYC